MSTVPAAARLPTIDGLRVVALLGVVVVNAAGYAAFPDSGHIVPPPAPADSAVAASTQWLVMTLFEGKAYPLLAFLFGVGFATSLRARGAGGVRHRRVRMLKLLVLGIAHGVLLYAGDVLTMYAVCGLLLLRTAGLRLARLRRRLWVWLGIAAVGIAGQVALGYVMAHAVGVPRTFADVSTWGEFIALNASRFIGSVPGWPLTLPQIMALMIAGIIAGRLRLLTHRRWRAGARRLASWAVPAGLLANAALAMLVLQPGATVATPPHPWAALFGVCGPVLSAGVAASIVARPAPWSSLAPAGRLTLSMYLGASVLMALTLSGSTLGWRLGSVATLLYGLVLYAALLGAAWIAGRAGRRGVLERWLSR